MRNWNQLKFVLAVDQNGSYGSAARELGASPVTVSRNINSLSDELGEAIFKLKDGSLRATDAGRELVELASEIRSRLISIEAVNAQHRNENQTIRINGVSFINSNFLAGSVGIFQERNVNLHLQLNASELSADLENGEADVCLRLSDPVQGNLTRLKLATFPVRVFHSPGDRPEEWIGLPDELNWLPEMAMCQNEFGKEPICRVDSYAAIANAIQRGGMAGALPSCLAKHIPDVVRLQAKHGNATVFRSLWMIYHTGRKTDPAIQATKDWLRTIFRSPQLCLCGVCEL